MSSFLKNRHKTDLILGCSSLAGLYKEIGESKSEEIIERALAKGILCFDTAPHYGCGLGEERLGRALKKHVHNITSVKLYTKVGRVMLSKDDFSEDKLIDVGNVPRSKDCIFPEAPVDIVPCLDYTSVGAYRSYHDSVRRLQTDQIFGLRLHDCESEEKFEASVAPNGALSALVKLKQQGLIQEVSLGMNDATYALRILRASPAESIDSVMIAGCWNLLDHDEAALELLNECQSRGITVQNAGIFASGVLVGGVTYKYSPAPVSVLARVAQWTDLANAFGVPLPAVAIAFASQPSVVVAVAVGVKEVSEVDDFITWANTPIPDELWSVARSLGLIASYVPEL